MAKIATAGNKGEAVRSDCYLALELTDSGGLEIELQSKVSTLYGNDIRELLHKSLKYFGISNARMQVEDSGALPFVLMARLEAAVKELLETDLELLPEMLSQNSYSSTKDRYRRTRMYLPGNTPKLMINAGIHSPDGIILDLEDSVAQNKKKEARYLVRNALRALDFYGAERMVRINQIPSGLADLDFIVPHYVNLILVPKCESPAQVEQVNDRINSIRKVRKIDYPIYLMPIIESALGVINAYEIATAADNVVALAVGLEDFTADIGTQRTNEGRESYLARCQIVLAARAAGKQPIDSVFSDVNDMEALEKVVQESKALGFDGMGCIHPRQIKVIHDNFAPDEEEIKKAQKIVAAFHEAQEKGLGVVSLGSKMIDPPVVKRAQHILQMAKTGGNGK
ncbi:MAG: HpcH/HpaI aldolase/citrate lyase family protein [Candidatus Cloacimonetes bacterium]|nr:HpcH/HpaI aldolase/citrate lyase family protein [Candidatus Cloacimonadota bacterium]